MLAAVTQAPGVMVIDEVAEPGPPGPQDVIIRPEIVRSPEQTPRPARLACC
jgi:hypothetical protein